MFEGQADLGGFGAEGSGGGGMPSITIYNTAIAQAIAEQGPGGVSPGPITGGGGPAPHHHHGPGPGPGGGGGPHHGPGPYHHHH